MSQAAVRDFAKMSLGGDSKNIRARGLWFFLPLTQEMRSNI